MKDTGSQERGEGTMSTLERVQGGIMWLQFFNESFRYF